MTDWVAASIWVHSSIATVSLGAVVALSGKSALGHGPAEKARKLAKQLFNQMASDLQKRMESSLNNYETSDDSLVRSMNLVVVDEYDPAEQTPTRTTKILGVGAEAIRNELSDFLTNYSVIMTDWKLLRTISGSLSGTCNQLRSWCMVCFVVSVLGLCVAGIGKFANDSRTLDGLAQVGLAIILPSVGAAVLYLILMVRARNRLSPLEDRYDDLLT